MSAIGARVYNMPKFIIPYSSQWNKNEYTIYDSNEIIKFKKNNYIMASFDIKFFTQSFVNLIKNK